MRELLAPILLLSRSGQTFILMKVTPYTTGGIWSNFHKKRITPLWAKLTHKFLASRWKLVDILSIVVQACENMIPPNLKEVQNRYEIPLAIWRGSWHYLTCSRNGANITTFIGAWKVDELGRRVYSVDIIRPSYWIQIWVRFREMLVHMNVLISENHIPCVS